LLIPKLRNSTFVIFLFFVVVLCGVLSLCGVVVAIVGVLRGYAKQSSWLEMRERKIKIQSNQLILLRRQSKNPLSFGFRVSDVLAFYVLHRIDFLVMQVLIQQLEVVLVAKRLRLGRWVVGVSIILGILGIVVL
jgi:hypothetical protein